MSYLVIPKKYSFRFYSIEKNDIICSNIELLQDIVFKIIIVAYRFLLADFIILI